MKLRNKTSLLLAVIILTVLSAMGFFYLRFLEKAIESSIFAGLSGVSSTSAEAVSKFLQVNLRDAQVIASGIPKGILEKQDKKGMQEYLREVMEVYPQFSNGIFILDSKGTHWADYPPHPELYGMSRSFQEYFIRTMQEQKGVVCPYRSGRTGEPVLTFTALLRGAKNEVLGMVGCSVQLLHPDALEGIRKTKIGNSGYIYIFDTSRLMILHPDKKRILQRDVPTGRNRLFDRAIEGFEGVGETINSRGTEMLLSVQHIPGSNWIIGAQQLRTEAFAPIRQARFLILISILFAVATAVGIGFLAVRRITAPLEKLRGAAMQLGQEAQFASSESQKIHGNFVEELNRIEMKDEVGELARVFLEMFQKLDQSFAQLRNSARDLRHQNEYLEAIHETSLGLLRRLDVSDLLEAILIRAGALVGCPNGYLCLYQAEGNFLEMQVGIGVYEKSVGFRLTPGEGLCGKVWQTGRPMVLEDYKKWPARLPDSAFDELRAVVGIPLKSETQVLGVIGLAHVEEERRFREEEVLLLSRFAELASIALDNARLYAELQKELDERKKMERALKESHERFVTVLDGMDADIYVADMKSHEILFMNKHMARTFGENLVGKICWQVFRGESSPCRHCTNDRLMNDAEHPAGVCVWESQNPVTGNWYLNYDRAIKWVDGRFVRLQVATNINERKKMEEESLKSQKLESLGVLAGGIAHDFNNLLTAVTGNISLAKTYAPLDTPLMERLEEAEKASVRAKDLTFQLLTFAKGGAPVKQVTSLKGVIEDSCRFALPGSKCKCLIDVPEDLWLVDADAGQISQVLHNLLLNSEQAMPGGGNIEVKAQNVTLDASRDLSLPPGDYVNISVSDNGAGIEKEHLSKIFDPYFTTKLHGNGLGLATVYSIVKKHEGHITVQSQRDIGTTFSVFLPASKEHGHERKKVQNAGLTGGQGRILLMDDEEIVRDVTSLMLRSMGYEVEHAEDGEESIRMFKAAIESGKPFDSVIMDLTIPGGMGGREAVAELLKIDPSIKVIVASGYSNDPVMASYREYGFSGVLGKPFRIEELSEILHRVMSE